jgi:hypothetical protein
MAGTNVGANLIRAARDDIGKPSSVAPSLSVACRRQQDLRRAHCNPLL